MPPITSKMIDKLSETVEDTKHSPNKKSKKVSGGLQAFKKHPSGEQDSQTKEGMRKFLQEENPKPKISGKVLDRNRSRSPIREQTTEEEKAQNKYTYDNAIAEVDESDSSHDLSSKDKYELLEL